MLNPVLAGLNSARCEDCPPDTYTDVTGSASCSACSAPVCAGGKGPGCVDLRHDITVYLGRQRDLGQLHSKHDSKLYPTLRVRSHAIIET